MSLGMHSDAISDCNQAIQKDPDFSKAYLRRARAYRVSTIGLQSKVASVLTNDVPTPLLSPFL